MKYLHRYLSIKGLASSSIRDFKAELGRIWFQLYRRKVDNDSSAFEHVFVGEEKDGAVIGFHNWVQFFIEELKGNLNYLGFILPRRRGRGHDDLPTGHEHVIAVQFQWVNGNVKNISTSIVGASPAFEIALYTMMYLASGEKTRVTLDGIDVTINVHRIHTPSGDKLSSSFPVMDQ